MPNSNADLPEVDEEYEQHINNFVLFSYFEIYKNSDDPNEIIQSEQVLQFLIRATHHYIQNEDLVENVSLCIFLVIVTL